MTVERRSTHGPSRASGLQAARYQAATPALRAWFQAVALSEDGQRWRAVRQPASRRTQPPARRLQSHPSHAQREGSPFHGVLIP